jgi:ATP-binding cassette, subfamily B, bacterial
MTWSFHFEAGKMHAIVGDNGSGKSTLVQLISLLYDDYSGTIRINGQDIKKYDPEDIRSHMSIMFQDFAQLQRLSVRENIGIGNVKSMETELGSIDAIAAEYNITDFINLDTVIGNLFNDHKDPDEKWQTDLSGGQWQKIGLARAFMRASDADLMVLDEATSALDVKSEHQFFHRLKTLRKDKTTIFITHEYITTASADCIHFMQNGKIVEKGTHAELMENDGEYAKRYMLQTQGHLKLKHDGRRMVEGAEALHSDVTGC